MPKKEEINFDENKWFSNEIRVDVNKISKLNQKMKVAKQSF